MNPLSIRFDVSEAQTAVDMWGFNCGPGALCAVLNMRPAEIRPHMLDFERKHYTNPRMMFEILIRLGVRHMPVDEWPSFGLVRIQWGGPWTGPGCPLRKRYRHTHWIACSQKAGEERWVFDVNATCVGGWVTYSTWSGQIVPWLLKECEPSADGTFWPTHCIQVYGNNEPASA